MNFPRSNQNPAIVAHIVHQKLNKVSRFVVAVEVRVGDPPRFTTATIHFVIQNIQVETMVPKEFAGHVGVHETVISPAFLQENTKNMKN